MYDPRSSEHQDSYSVTPNFKYGEFKCSHCGGNHTPLHFIERLQVARDHSNEIGPGTVYAINSGYRCPVHNQVVGGRIDSAHIYGVAADISVPNNYRRMCILYGLINAGFRRCGMYDDFIHVDMKDTISDVSMWMI